MLFFEQIKTNIKVIAIFSQHDRVFVYNEKI